MTVARSESDAPSAAFRRARNRRRWVRGCALGLTAATMSLSLGACGSSKKDSASTSGSGATTSASSGDPSSGAPSGVKIAAANVAAHRSITTSFVAPGPSIDARSLKGKTIWYLPVSAEIPVLQVEAAGVKQAAAALGMTYRTCDGQNLPADASACITQAVSAGAAGIITDSIDPTAVSTAISDAVTHKVPIVSAEDVGKSAPGLQFTSLGDPESEPVAANWIIANSGGKANVLTASVSGNRGTVSAENAFVSTMKKNCPSCALASVSAPPPELTNITSAVSTALLQHPSTTYAFAQFDFLEPLAAKGIQTAGKKLQIVSTNAVLADMKAIKTGGQVADIGANRNFLGWQAVDRLARMMLDKPAPTHTTVPIRVFDSTNIGSIPLTQAASVSGIWWGPLTYRRKFEQLWGVA
jgi:ribose transport system substrate-binding protein